MSLLVIHSFLIIVLYAESCVMLPLGGCGCQTHCVQAPSCNSSHVDKCFRAASDTALSSRDATPGACRDVPRYTFETRWPLEVLASQAGLFVYIRFRGTYQIVLLDAPVLCALACSAFTPVGWLQVVEANVTQTALRDRTKGLCRTSKHPQQRPSIVPKK